MTTQAGDRNVVALATVARFRMLTRRQLKRWRFPTVSETVAKRWVDRMCAAGYLGRERSAANGVQYLWCTSKGRDHLVEQGYLAADLFPARGPVAAKDLRHSLWIVDVAIALSERSADAAVLFPAWLLQRLYGGAMPAVPDLLVLTPAALGTQERALAVEVDLGSESLRVLLSKLVRLEGWLLANARSASVGMLVLTNAPRRRASIAAALTRARLQLPAAVDLLPSFTSQPELEPKEDQRTTREA